MFSKSFRPPELTTTSHQSNQIKQIQQRIHPVLTFTLTIGIALWLSTNAFAQHYQQTNLVSDVPGLAAMTDPNLVNAWGLARSATSPWWVADNGTGLSTLYNGAGSILSLVVTIPVPPGGTPPSKPTGVVFNGSADFQGARFIFVTEDGTISGWSGGTSAVLKVNNAGSAIYKGVAIAQSNGANLLYAANFHAGTIEVYDGNYMPFTHLPPGAFSDRRIPAGFAPFNIQNIEGRLFVAYAKQDEDAEDEVAGPGLGFVDEFDADGNLLLRLNKGRWMNAPWGMVLTPSGFGKLSNRLLVGQFGSGEIASFDPVTGNFQGLMRGVHGQPLTIDGLWALSFGNGATAEPTNTLFFTAGIDDEAHGLFGTITPIPGDDDEQ